MGKSFKFCRWGAYGSSWCGMRRFPDELWANFFISQIAEQTWSGTVCLLLCNSCVLSDMCTVQGLRSLDNVFPFNVYFKRLTRLSVGIWYYNLSSKVIAVDHQTIHRHTHTLKSAVANNKQSTRGLKHYANRLMRHFKPSCIHYLFKINYVE